MLHKASIKVQKFSERIAQNENSHTGVKSSCHRLIGICGRIQPRINGLQIKLLSNITFTAENPYNCQAMNLTWSDNRNFPKFAENSFDMLCNAVSILGFKNCQSFFSATAHVRCTAPARPTPRGRCRSAHMLLAKRHCDRHQPATCEQLYKKHNIVTFFYIKLVIYYNKRSWKSRGIADLKQNP